MKLAYNDGPVQKCAFKDQAIPVEDLLHHHLRRS